MIYVTADLHGYPLEKFLKLLNKAGFSEEDYLFILGDVIDRGEDGVEILKWLLEQPNAELILGNHEAMLLACSYLFEEITDRSVETFGVEKLKAFEMWRANGADPTIRALLKTRASTREEIFDYLRDAPLYDVATVGERNFLLVHGGLGGYRADKKIREYTEGELLWSRAELSMRYSDDFITIFGHTPTCAYGSEYEGRIIKTETWINIDVGVSCGFAPALLRLDDMKEFYAD